MSFAIKSSKLFCNINNIKRMKIIPLNDFSVKYKVFPKEEYAQALQEHVKPDDRISYNTFKNTELENVNVVSIEKTDSAYRMVIFINDLLSELEYRSSDSFGCMISAIELVHLLSMNKRGTLQYKTVPGKVQINMDNYNVEMGNNEVLIQRKGETLSIALDHIRCIHVIPDGKRDLLEKTTYIFITITYDDYTNVCIDIPL